MKKTIYYVLLSIALGCNICNQSQAYDTQPLPYDRALKITQERMDREAEEGEEEFELHDHTDEHRSYVENLNPKDNGAMMLRLKYILIEIYKMIYLVRHHGAKSSVIDKAIYDIKTYLLHMRAMIAREMGE